MILMIDDEEKWIEEYIEELEDEGYTVNLITKVDDVSPWLVNPENVNSVQLIILDMMMPPGEKYSDKETELGVRTGEFVLQSLRETVPSIPVLILTNRDKEFKGKIIEGKYEEYLYKRKTRPSQLVKIVKNIIN